MQPLCGDSPASAAAKPIAGVGAANDEEEYAEFRPEDLASPLVLLRIGPRLAVRHQSLLHNTARHVKAYEKTVWKNLSF